MPYSEIRPSVLGEARVDLIAKQVQNLLDTIQFEKEGNPIEVDGFRLRDIKDWTVDKNNDIFEIIRYLGANRPCGARCKFCYLRGNPPDCIYSERTCVPWEEVRLRLEYYVESPDKMLFPTTFDCFEVLTHPRLFEVMTHLRAISSQELSVSTNGQILRKDFVERLAGFKPVKLNVSLNSANPLIRGQIMGIARPEVGIESLKLLRDYEIPFTVSIVTWPTIPLSDLVETIWYANQYEPERVSIYLPGFTKFNKPSEDYDFWVAWETTVQTVQELRQQVETPIITEPIPFEQDLYGVRWNSAKVLGVVKGSPAAQMGIKRDDIILAVNGKKVRSRPHLFWLWRLATGLGKTPALTIKRRGMRIDLAPKSDSAAGCEDPVSFGVYVSGGLDQRDFTRLVEIISETKARNVLLFCSTLMRRSVEQAIDELDFPSQTNADVQLCEVKSRYFGGNIMAGSLMTADDYLYAVGQLLDNSGVAPDLILIPFSSKHNWWRDVSGAPLLSVGWKSGIPTRIFCPVST